MSDYLSSRQAAKLLGVSESTIKRMCDEAKLKSLRTPGGHRRIASGSIRQWQSQFGSLGSESSGKASPEEALEYLLTDQPERLEKEVLSNAQEGPDAVIALFDETLAPAMWTVGQKWATGELDVFEEHRCSMLLRRVLMALRSEVGRDEIKQPLAPLAIGGCIGGEEHDLASLMVEIVMVSLGWDARSLGANLPIDSLLAANLKLKPKLVWLSYTRVSDDRFAEFTAEHQRIVEALQPEQKLVVGGQALNAEQRRALQFDFAADSFAHLARFVRMTFAE